MNVCSRRLESATATAEQIVLAMKKISYITDDVASDEVVIMKFLHVIRSLLLSQVGCLLSNSGVCELIQAIIKIIFDPGFGLLVKKMAEQTWGEVVQLMFARLPQFSEDVHDDFQLKQLRIRGNGASSIEHRQRRRPGHGRVKKMKTQEEMPFSIGNPTRAGHPNKAHDVAAKMVDCSEQLPSAQCNSIAEASLHPEQKLRTANEDDAAPRAEVASPKNAESIDERSAESNAAENEAQKRNGIRGEEEEISIEDVKERETRNEREVGLSESVEIVSGDSIDEGGHVVHLCGSVNSLNEIGHQADEHATVDAIGQVIQFCYD